ncbi:hypothetical protein NON00_04660 [Roseomonas sp. GC11]|uniref:hypothetical protein n=1 Tax=Roseomonas sp. GC11 TaxID=2950546 RepID=UPI002109CCFA|nr:hypothetical protein [Roseomonas sp. GC11]MCQ4159213.1 hypothetical protein [Roseomonas sp. GC11]
MTNRTTLAQLRTMDAAQVACLPVDHLALLLDEVAALRADAKHLADLLHDALHARYGQAAAAARRAEGKDTGRVRIADEAFAVIADLPKKAVWDQPKLAEAVATLRGWGEDPADYVTTEIRVAESRFTAWPPRIRAVFEPARTLATGRPSYTLAPKDAA